MLWRRIRTRYRKYRKHAGLTEEEVIEIHSSKDYLIYMLGFLPGFSYLGGLDERIHTPRLANPRIRIPAGSVGIGGSQTGIYPLDSPGGWQLLGMTPVKTYDPEREDPILFEAGDYIRFVPVSEEEYKQIKEQVENGTYECVIHTKGGVNNGSSYTKRWNADNRAGSWKNRISESRIQRIRSYGRSFF